MVSRLKTVLRERHLQTHSAFGREYDRVAATIDPDLVGSAPKRAQFHRWLSGEVKGLPYPHHCRVLEKMLPGHTATELFAPDTTDQQCDAPAKHPVTAASVVGPGQSSTPTKHATASETAPSLRSGSPAPPASGAGHLPRLMQLPPDTHDFTGRDEQISLLVSQLAGGPGLAVPIATVVGSAGVGKTALATHVAHTLADVFPDGQLYVNLHGVESNPLAPGEVLSGFLRALGIDGAQVPEDLDERARLFRALLADRRVLVVLDNAAAESQLRLLLPGSSTCAVLVTSRSPLAALSGSQTLNLGVLPNSQAIALLARLIGPERAEAEPGAVADIARLCGCLPLALRIAGARLVSRPGWMVAWFADRLADESRRLDVLKAGDLEVRASFDLSYHGRSTDEQRTFGLLSLTAATFPAWNVATLLDIGIAEAEARLDELVDAQLVELAGTDVNGTVRYRLHDLMRDFARERANAQDTPGERRAAAERLVDRYLQCMRIASAALHPGAYESGGDDVSADTPAHLAQMDPRGWFTAERANLLAAVELAHALELWDSTWQLTETLPPMFDWRADWQAWDRTHGLALHAAQEAGNDRAEAVTRRSLGALCRELGRYDDACGMLGRAAEIFQRLEAPSEWAVTLRLLGDTFRYQGRLREAIANFSTALDVAESGSDIRIAAGIHNGIADASRGLSRWGDARRHFDTSLTMYRSLDDRLEGTRTRVRYGLIHRDRWDNDRALREFEYALPVFREFDDQRWQARTLRHIAVVHRNEGDIPHALTLFAECLTRFDQLSDRRGVAVTLRNRGDAHRLAEKHAEAATDLAAAHDIFRSLGDQRWVARTHLSLADLDRRNQRWDDAIHRVKTALDTFTAIGDRPGEGRTLRQLGLIHRDTGDLDAATAALSAADEVFAGLHDDVWIARVQAGRAPLAETRGSDPTPDLVATRTTCQRIGITGHRLTLVLKEW
ncbi:ATP-binding protein [Nocardia australiensis]|uniref:ATP-binding protein n=1 Tax=Nocardia australiensis TaxID=2887191 RepID=UPI001D156C53|nr:tetratricopeptide repeat protein [Nocardia australiensis]